MGCEDGGEEVGVVAAAGLEDEFAGGGALESGLVGDEGGWKGEGGGGRGREGDVTSSSWVAMVGGDWCEGCLMR